MTAETFLQLSLDLPLSLFIAYCILVRRVAGELINFNVHYVLRGQHMLNFFVAGVFTEFIL